MAFADSKTANSKCLDSKFADSKYLDSKQKIKITNFWKKWEIFKDKDLSFQLNFCKNTRILSQTCL